MKKQPAVIYKEITLILPNQLLKNNPAIQKNRLIILYEEPTYFTAFNFHKQKLIFHRATMKAYEEFLQKNYQVTYVEYYESSLSELLCNYQVDIVHTIDPTDNSVSAMFKKISSIQKIKFILYESPLFLTPIAEFNNFFSNIASGKRFSMQHFYIAQRKQLHILINSNNKPVGGRWNFDVYNRKKLPSTQQVPEIKK